MESPAGDYLFIVNEKAEKLGVEYEEFFQSCTAKLFFIKEGSNGYTECSRVFNEPDTISRCGRPQQVKMSLTVSQKYR